MRIIAVAERVHDPSLSEGDVWQHKRDWWRDRLEGILVTPAMRLSTTRERMGSMLGLFPDRVVNLLWPDRLIGTWDREEAKASAYILWEWARRNQGLERTDQVAGLVLLGRKVTDAFGFHTLREWGSTILQDGGPPVLSLPHPSGRNRVLNDKDMRQKLQRDVELFRQIVRKRG